MAAFNTSPIMQRVIEQTLPSFEGGTLSPEHIRSINDAETIETAVGGEAIFRMMNEAIAHAQRLNRLFVPSQRSTG